MSSTFGIKKDEQSNFILSSLPCTDDYLEPYLGERTVRFHYWKHLKTYLDKVNALNNHKERTLEQVVLESSVKGHDLYKHSSQALNHCLYFEQLNARGCKEILPQTRSLLENSRTTWEDVKQKMIDQGMSIFGSGWVFFTRNDAGTVSVLPFTGTGTPLRRNTILLALDVWEHAYYLDYQNDRRCYLENFFAALDWSVVEKRLQKGSIWK